MLLRPIRAEDAKGLAALYDRLSPESAYQRFFTVMQHLPADWARVLAAVDHERQDAIVAVDGDGGLVGVARYGCDAGSDEAEIALVVEDAWQGRGLGTTLMEALLAQAGSRGLTRFRAYVLAGNRRMLRLVEELGVVTERALDQGVVSLRFTRRPDGARARRAPAAGSPDR